MIIICSFFCFSRFAAARDAAEAMVAAGRVAAAGRPPAEEFAARFAAAGSGAGARLSRKAMSGASLEVLPKTSSAVGDSLAGAVKRLLHCGQIRARPFNSSLRASFLSQFGQVMT